MDKNIKNMCGILGKLNYNHNNSENIINDLLKLTHRGPDDSGIWHSENKHVILGHTRLSILDLSSTAHQPMISSCGRFIIVFNGEIYNYQEIRTELQRFGYHFNGSGDTEVVLTAYQHWQDKCLNKFNGMFALAIWDKGSSTESAQLFIARDRVGKKPFYYIHKKKLFEFASELKALTHSNEINLRALNFYLALGYIPNNLCINEGVNKLPPAHAGIFRPDTGELRVWCYWQLPTNNPDFHCPVESLVEEAESLLNDSVRLRLRSDVPVGVLLSGGLDSSLLAAMAANISPKKIKTFTVSFPGTRYDEANYANIVAKHFNTEHHVLEVSAPSLDILREYSPFIDEPLADSSLLPSYMVSKLTAQHVKVALGGDGGDELFGGYGDYTQAFIDQHRIGWIPPLVMATIGKFAGKLPAGVKGRNRLYALQGEADQAMIWGSPYFDIALRSRVLSPSHLQELGGDIASPEKWLLSLYAMGQNSLDKMTRTHFGSILPDDFLVKVDRTSMANSLELRAPFLDYRLVEFAFSKIPSEWKVKGQESRRLQKLIAQRILPNELDVNRKQGFSIPLDNWLRASRCIEIEELRHSLPDCISQAEVSRLITGHMKGRANGSRLFSLIMLALAQQNNQ
ncbi:asparagine synthase (glutamine-hydrolyzing) [Thiothrix sp.]|uniref:asparagine synthase (glutamine-hydrolyzing) n=1 Tax=Thiothrix sp. TaxID=1032 RepID=UPI00257D9CA2|nr:asparagine synthase (glutamine-hydrolyzing) [Thiothrix sp.]